MKRLICFLLMGACVLLPSAAWALPGQTNAQFVAWAKSNAALQNVKQAKDDMSGLPDFLGTFKTGNIKGNFLAVSDNSKITTESVAIMLDTENYDILKHPEIANALVAAVYGADVAADLKSATKVGTWTLKDQTQATTLYRGSKYGYELAYRFVQLMPLSAVDAEAKHLATCVKEQCGD